MVEIKELKEQIENFEGDKRSKEYKDLKKRLEELENDSNINESNDNESPTEHLTRASSPPYDPKYYEEIKSWTGYIKDSDKFFEMYNKTFNRNYVKCNCPLKVRKMVKQMKKIYELWLRNR